MPYTPAGPLMIPLDRLRQSIARSSTFQAWTSSADQAAALARVHLAKQDDPQSLPKPFALVDWGQGMRYVKVTTSAPSHRVRGPLIMRFEIDVDGNETDAYANFLSTVGQILDDLAADAISGLHIDAFTALEPPVRSSKDDGADYFRQTFQLELKQP